MDGHFQFPTKNLIKFHLLICLLLADIAFQDKMVIYDNERQQIGWVPKDCNKLPKSWTVPIQVSSFCVAVLKELTKKFYFFLSCLLTELIVIIIKGFHQLTWVWWWSNFLQLMRHEKTYKLLGGKYCSEC